LPKGPAKRPHSGLKKKTLGVHSQAEAGKCQARVICLVEGEELKNDTLEEQRALQKGSEGAFAMGKCVKKAPFGGRRGGKESKRNREKWGIEATNQFPHQGKSISEKKTKSLKHPEGVIATVFLATIVRTVKMTG